MSAPPQALRQPSEEELQRLFRRVPVAGVRFAGPVWAPGKPSFQIVCDNPSYGLENLSANVRSKVRRGLRRCEIARIPPAEAAAAGRQAHDDTLARQGRRAGLPGGDWSRFWRSVAMFPEIEVWGAWVERKLAAFVVAVPFGESIELMLARSRSDCLGAYPNNALLYAVTREMLVERGIREVTFGLESLEPVGPLDNFKFSMGFRRRPLRQRVVFRPLLAALLRHASVRSLLYRGTARATGRGGVWQKAAGLVRFAEESGL